MNIFTFGDLLEHFPFRHVDRTKINFIKDISPQMDFVQVAVVVVSLEAMGQRQGKRLVAEVKDKTGRMELTWFQSLSWVEKSIEVGQSYLVYGRVSFYNGQPQIVHPETELLSINQQPGKNFLEPVYSTTEKLKARGLGGRQIGKLTQLLMGMVHEKDVPENLPESILNKLKLINRFKAYRQIHFPQNADEFNEAVNRIKFEELFLSQLRMNMLRSHRHRFSKGVVFEKVGDLFNTFYEKHLPFQLTGAQKRVVKEIRNDTAKGKQMNRLLQGDVGSGKTIVAVLCMLLAADNGCQSCLMAPTEILAQQHFKTISELLGKMDVPVQILTGSTKAAARRKILQQLIDGQLQILIGTHAVIEEVVKFKNLGIVIIDEQHRFGVAQRAKLWQKASVPPHILVMTATPIPRTLAMTAYGDLDYSVIDELPPGRQPITTVHRYESQRSKVMSFIRTEISINRRKCQAGL